MKYANISFSNKVSILIVLTILATVGVFMAGAIPESGVYHDFADKRPLWGIPHFFNVVSNLPFIITGIVGLIMVGRSSAPGPVPSIYAVLFAGVLLTGLGSAWYHIAPDNNTLVYDRIPMTIVFMSLLSATLSEFVNPRLGGLLLGPLVITGVTSVWWWHYTELQGAGDLRLYILVQYYPMLLIPLILWLFPSAGSRRGGQQLAGVVIWYFIAKACDIFDRFIYAFTGFVSGHTLKHLAAAVATLYLVRLFQFKHFSYDAV
ncbi:ceramidase domain-containing protein [Flavitalea sp. BT771]|uniref:ceramidase domain-containing protein n=1 Tax=Flavitalea sp. BT771 TaxID=3063329 RepID=UPI0026E1D73B|nr:ceramidase domain-containing protein [Flavitalea sp. BT771]MDO6432844.1 ceramidase domain-containing protein [Flavitalea sp. BT771]MDV6221880.1 ceramidase domain-containing protein [Flavitalea sp. BT771]